MGRVPDRVEHHPPATQQVDDRGGAEVAHRVAAVGVQHEHMDAGPIAGALDVPPEGVVERGAPAGLAVAHPLEELRVVERLVAAQPHGALELDERHVPRFREVVDEPDGRVRRRLEIALHAETLVEHQAELDRHGVRQGIRKRDNVLPDAALSNLEIVGGEPQHGLASPRDHDGQD